MLERKKEVERRKKEKGNDEQLGKMGTKEEGEEK